MAASGYTPIILFNSGTTGNKPTTSNLTTGELALNYADGVLYYNNGSAIKSISGGGASSTYTRTSITASASQTTFTVTYTVGYVEVYLNGSFLNGADYTATNGTTVVLATGTSAGDIVEFIAYNTTAIGNATNISGGSAGVVPYQSAASTTLFTAAGTSGQPLLSGGTGSPTWGTLGGTYGGTGVNNGSYTITVGGNLSTGGTFTTGGNLTFSGAFATTVTVTAATSVTLPVSGTLGYQNIPQNSQSANYTTVLADSGYAIFHPASDANARTFTIAANASVAYPIGTVIQFINMSANAVTISITSDTLTWAQGGGTGSRTLAQYGIANCIKIATTQWLLTGTNVT